MLEIFSPWFCVSGFRFKVRGLEKGLCTKPGGSSVLSKVAEKRFGSLPSWISLAMVDRWIFQFSSPVQSLFLSDHLYDDGPSHGMRRRSREGKKVLPSYYGGGGRRPFFSSDFRHVMQLSKLMVPISSHSIHSQDRHAIQNVKPFLLSRNQLWEVCWLSYEYFSYALCKIYNLKLQSLSYFAIRPTNIV